MHAQILWAIVNGFEQWWLVTLVPAVVLLLEILALYSAAHALKNVRTSQAAVAWVVTLLALPFLALPLYWVLGRSRFAGYREAIREVGEAHKESVAAVRRELMTDDNAHSHPHNSPLERVADVLDTPISFGNRFELLIDGDAFFDALFREIGEAEHYVYACFYILRDDEIGNRFAEALIERARAGITVRLLYDEVGCLRLSQEYLSRLGAAGVDVRSFNTRQGWVNRFQLNFRNHRKLVVIDGKSSIVGGLNIGDEYLGKTKWADGWRDTSVLMRGGVTRKAQAAFASDYYWAARRDLPEANWSDQFDIQYAEDSENQQSGAAAICATGPADFRPRATIMFAAAAAVSEQRLWISSPYLVPDDSCVVALSMAKARGVDVRILLPAVADQWPVFLAGFHYEEQFDALGIPVERYTKGFLHQKCVLVDNSLAFIGSTNLDNRSLHLNFEMMALIADPQFVKSVAKMLEDDFASIKPVEDRRKRLRPWFIRVGTAVARLFSPIL